MNETSETQNTTGLIFKRIPEIMAAVGAVGKNNVNQGQKYSFRGIDDFYNALHPHLAAAKVFSTPEVLSQQREERKTANGGNLIYTILTVRHTFYAEDGSSVATVTVGEAMDSGDKSSNKAMSAAMKYAMIELFCIPTEEKLDTEFDSPQPLPRQSTQPSQQPRQAQRAPQTAPAGDTGEVPPCSKCGGPVWDNRFNKKNPKQPDFKCKDKSCDHAEWLKPKSTQSDAPQAAQTPATQQYDDYGDVTGADINWLVELRDWLHANQPQHPQLDDIVLEIDLQQAANREAVPA